MTLSDSTTFEKPTSFRQLCQVLEDALGGGFIPPVEDAKYIREVLLTASECDSLARSLLAAVYQHNRCRHLDSPVTLLPTLDGMGQLRGKLCDGGAAGPDQIARLETAGEAALKVLSAPAAEIPISASTRPDSQSSGAGPIPHAIRQARR
jgi:hypothetical protein